MKSKKIKAISLTLASALLSAGVGGAIVAQNVKAEEAKTYSLSNLFRVTDGKSEVKADNNVTALVMQDESSVKFKNSLALKWYQEVGEDTNKTVEAQYFTTTFAFKELNFNSVTFTMESQSAWATEDEKAVNKLVFEYSNNALSVIVNDDTANKTPITYTAGDQLIVSLGEEDNAKDGEFIVSLNGTKVGKFENVGANYAEYTVNKKSPFIFEADMPAAQSGAAAPQATVLLYDINGQQFDNLKDDKVEDKAAPVLVVNEDIHSFLYGAAFSLDYTVLDVLKVSNLDKNLEYYQYNPSHTGEKKYNTLDTSVYFLDTTYYKDATTGEPVTEGGKLTSVYKEKSYELVSIKMKPSDGTNSENYDLSWYVAGSTETIDNVTYIPVNNTKTGPSYEVLTANEPTQKNVETADYDKLVDAFQKQIENKAAELYAGSDSYLYFPSMKWLFSDDNGYRNLKFTISYKTENSSTPKTASGLSYNSVKLTVASKGAYEFRVFANDKAGNTMKYYDKDGELVSITTANVWDIEGIPTFKFTIADKGMKAKDPTSASGRRDTEIVDQSYTFTDVTVQGASDLQKNYKLYKVDLSKYEGTGLNRSKLTAVSYEALASKINLASVEDKNYFELYINAYAALLADSINAPETDIKKIAECFVPIEEYDARITEENAPEEWDAYNKYQWQPDSKSFNTAEEGTYLIMADYYDKELATYRRAAAYKLIIVDSEADVIDGDNNWVENNIASVILFAFAGVCLIALVVLLLVKPSEETLEDIDAQAAAKEEKASKKEDK